MLHQLSDQNTISNKFIQELRDKEIQANRPRFRKNLENLGSIFAYEISKTFTYAAQDVETPLGVANMNLPEEEVYIVALLRAGMPLQDGMLNMLPNAEIGFISSNRRQHKDGTLDVTIEYSSASNFNDKVLVVVDPMIATGSSIVRTLEYLYQEGKPKITHVVSVIAAKDGLDYIKRMFPKVHVWVGEVDEELTAKSFVVPGIGDVGDLSFGPKNSDF